MGPMIIRSTFFFGRKRSTTIIRGVFEGGCFVMLAVFVQQCTSVVKFHITREKLDCWFPRAFPLELHLGCEAFARRHAISKMHQTS